MCYSLSSVVDTQVTQVRTHFTAAPYTLLMYGNYNVSCVPCKGKHIMSIFVPLQPQVYSLLLNMNVLSQVFHSFMLLHTDNWTSPFALSPKHMKGFCVDRSYSSQLFCFVFLKDTWWPISGALWDAQGPELTDSVRKWEQVQEQEVYRELVFHNYWWWY